MSGKPKYLVFAGDNYYPGGGADDFVSIHGDQAEALLAMPRSQDWAQVAELHGGTLVVVASYGEFNPGELMLYPERMAHRRQPAPEAP